MWGSWAMKNLRVRISVYIFGLFIMAIGVALSVRSNLGVSPVSSIPYTMTCVWGMEMGKATILFHIALVLLQILLLRREFHPVQLLQIVAGVVFGYFTTFCNYLVTFLPVGDLLVVRAAMIFMSAFFVAWGIFPIPPHKPDPSGGGGRHARSVPGDRRRFFQGQDWL